MKAESLQVKRTWIVSFEIHFGGVQSLNAEKCVFVVIFVDLTDHS